MSAQKDIVTGYYRWTDIWFEWCKVLPNLDDASPLKAILSHDAITHEDHPLRVEGVNGARMYMGTYESGEARLLMSSAQVDYIRYWLHAMGLTKEMIPLPYSDCMLLEKDLKNVSPVVFSNGGELRQAHKMVEKNNKRVKGAGDGLSDRRLVFERVRSLWAAKKGVWCAIDFEAWERDHTIITEVGFSYVGWKDGEEIRDHGHIIPERARSYRNGTYVPDRLGNYNFGKTMTVPTAELGTHVKRLITLLQEFGAVYLVFHGNNQDVKDLKRLQGELENLTFILPEKPQDSGFVVVDTSEMIGGLLGLAKGVSKKLEETCKLLQIDGRCFHNAGNDAYYTLQALEAMAQGDPLDTQREKRWPNRTTTGFKVDIKPWEEKSDYESDDDDEFVLPKAHELETAAKPN